MIDGRLLVDAHVHVARLPTLSQTGRHGRARSARETPLATLFDADGVPLPAALDEHFAAQGADHVLVFTEYSPKATGHPADRGRASRWSRQTRDRFRPVANLNPHLHYPVRRGAGPAGRPGRGRAQDPPGARRLRGPGPDALPGLRLGRAARPAGHRALRDVDVLRVDQLLRRPDPARRGVPGLPGPDRRARARRPRLVVRAGRVPGADPSRTSGSRCPACRRSGCPTTTAARCAAGRQDDLRHRLAGRARRAAERPGVEKVLLEAGCTADQVAAVLGGNAASVFRLR